MYINNGKGWEASAVYPSTRNLLIRRNTQRLYPEEGRQEAHMDIRRDTSRLLIKKYVMAKQQVAVQIKFWVHLDLMHLNLLHHLRLLFDMDQNNVRNDDMHQGQEGIVILEDRVMDHIFHNLPLRGQVLIIFHLKDKFEWVKLPFNKVN